MLRARAIFLAGDSNAWLSSLAHMQNPHGRCGVSHNLNVQKVAAIKRADKERVSSSLAKEFDINRVALYRWD